jgi:osmotically-inducible protein OsmY
MQDRYQDRYDDIERGSQGRSQNRPGERREEFDREDYRRDDMRSGSRNRGNWENEQEQRFGGTERGRESTYGGQRSDYGGQRNDYGSQRNDYGGQRNERNWEQRGSDWQRERGDWGRERYGSNAGENTYTGNRQESYSGGAGMYGQQQFGQQQHGRFSGKGPKGYQRSDERIREEICERLTQHPEIDASEIEVKVDKGEVTLTGTVEERQAKRLAEDAVENISGVRDVHNQLRVANREATGQQQHSGKEAGTLSGAKGGD